MATERLRVLVATDGSASARAAVTAAATFPWPRASEARGVVVRGLPIPTEGPLPATVWQAMDDALRREAERAQTALRRRWPGAEIVVTDGMPATAILAEARRWKADAVVVGSRGHGMWSRLVLGSVSRGVVRHARGGILVVKGEPRAARRFVIGVDGSAHARRAVRFVAALEPPPGARVRLVAALEPVRPAAIALLPATVRATLASEASRMEAQRERAARRQLDVAAKRLGASGWSVDQEVRTGVPLDQLLEAAAAARADVVVVGARGVGGVERLLLGSVADGVLSHSPVSVLVVH